MDLTTSVTLNHLPGLPENPSHVWDCYRWTTDDIKAWFDIRNVLTIITRARCVRCSFCTGTSGAGTLLTAPVICSEQNKTTLGSWMLKKRLKKVKGLATVDL